MVSVDPSLDLWAHGGLPQDDGSSEFVESYHQNLASSVSFLPKVRITDSLVVN